MTSRSFSRRLRTLEARLDTGPCADEKWAIIHRSAIELMSESDLKLLNQACDLRDTGRTAECTLDHYNVLARWANTQDQAFAESDLRFTITEMDDMLAST